MLRSGKNYKLEPKVVGASSKPARQPLNQSSKVIEVEKLEKSTIRLLKSQGKFRKQVLPTRVKPSCRLKVPPIPAPESPERKPAYHIPLQISTASDWESVDSS